MITHSTPAWWNGSTCARCGVAFTNADPMPDAGPGGTDVCAGGCGTVRRPRPARTAARPNVADNRVRCVKGHVVCDHCNGCVHTGTLGGMVRRDKDGDTLCEQCRHDRDIMGITNKRTGKVFW